MTEQSQLDRIEALLTQTAQGVASNAQAIQQGNDRLDRIEVIVANNAQAINRNSELIASNAQAIQRGVERTDSIIFETQRLINGVAEKVDRADAVAQQNRITLETLMRMMQSIQADILRLQVDVRGVQVENQRILRHLFGQGEGRDD